ncbi:type II secretion system protein [Sulfurimonas sp.]|uniref:type II secretion system protein n=1 Tax=Sulfurimonas sp. TaxID=2022749 RepID=UPI003D0E8BD4
MVRGLKKQAFTLIELIFAIVVMSIVVMSLPIMMQTTSRAIEDNIVQEAIFAASAELMGATTFYWDLNSTTDFNLSNLSRVIDTNGDCENNNSSTRHRLRPGHIEQPFHRRCLDSTDNNISSTADATFQNLDNAVHANQVIFTDNVTEAKGYKESYRSTMSINLLNNNNNVKQLTSTITDADGNTLTVLRTFCANIGEVEYYKRRF